MVGRWELRCGPFSVALSTRISLVLSCGCWGQPSLLTAREGGRVLEETNQTEELVERVAALDIGRRS